MSKIKPILIVLALLALGAATTAMADYDFEGEATGQCGTIHPWATWEGTLHTGASPYFAGTWACGEYYHGTIFGWAEYDSETRCYYVEEGTWDTEGEELEGTWEGYFCPSSEVEPTAWGTWEGPPGVYCEGEFWGSLAD